MKKLMIIALVLTATTVFAKPPKTSTTVQTNCGPVCTGGMVCLVKQADGSYVTTASTPPIGRKFVLDTAGKCWRPG